jgi:hypothetical protein
MALIQSTTTKARGSVQALERISIVAISSDRVLVEALSLAALEAAGDLECLVLRADGRGVRGEVPGRCDEDVRAGGCAAMVGVAPEGGLDHLDRVEVAVLAEKGCAQRGEQTVGTDGHNPETLVMVAVASVQERSREL